MEEAGNTENFSENKRKRGRPKKVLENGLTYNQWVVKQGNLLNTDNRSMRAYINEYYQLKAFGCLRDSNGNHPLDGEFAFIVSADSHNMYNPIVKNFKRTILQELGRLEDPEIIKFVAKQICIDKLKTSEAIILIRSYRKSDIKPIMPEDLAKKIGKLIDDFRTINYEIDSKFIMEALYITQEAYSENFS